MLGECLENFGLTILSWVGPGCGVFGAGSGFRVGGAQREMFDFCFSRVFC